MKVISHLLKMRNGIKCAHVKRGAVHIIEPRVTLGTRKRSKKQASDKRKSHYPAVKVTRDHKIRLEFFLVKSYIFRSVREDNGLFPISVGNRKSVEVFLRYLVFGNEMPFSVKVL